MACGDWTNDVKSAPSHCPCTTRLTNTTILELFPGMLDWINLISDARAPAMFTVVSPSTKGKKTLSFDHDTG
jgi:hypothetical protein